MQRIVGAFTILAVLAGAAWFFLRPTTISVSATLQGTETEVSEHVDIIVSILSDDPGVDNERLFPPFDGIYDVDPGRTLVISGRATGFEIPGFEFTPTRGTHTDIALPVEAGLVNVTAPSADGLGTTRVRWGVVPGSPSKDVPETDVVTFLTPPGPQEFEAQQDLNNERGTVDVVSGETHNVTLDARRATIDVSFETAIPWGDHFPNVRYNLDGFPVGDGDGLVPLRRRSVSYGQHTVSVELGIGGPRVMDGMISPESPFTVNETESDHVVQLSLVYVMLDVTAWDQSVLEDADAMIRYGAKHNLSLAASEIHNGHAPLVFFPQDDNEPLVVAIARGNDVLAVQPLDALLVDQEVRLSIAPGGDLALCQATFEVANCATLRP